MLSSGAVKDNVYSMFQYQLLICLLLQASVLSIEQSSPNAPNKTSTISCPTQLVQCSCKRHPSGSGSLVDCRQGGLRNEDILVILKQMPSDVVRLRFDPPPSMPNNFSITADFARFVRLRELRLCRSGLLTLGKRILEQLRNLRILDVSGNRIEHLSLEAFENADGIEQLYLDNNRLSRNYLASSNFAYLRRLKLLSLRGNGISYIPNNLFGGLRLLETLYLDGNPLQSIVSDAFDALPLLRTLTMNGCQLMRVPKALFLKSRSIETLALGSNKLVSVPTDLVQYLSHMRVLDLRDNFISLLPDMTLSGTSVKKLILAGNLLGVRDANFELQEQGIQPLAFYNSSVTELDLSDNRYTRFSSKTLQSAKDTLTILHLSSNPLRSLEPEQTAGLSLLRGLHVANVFFDPDNDLPVPLPAEYQQLQLLNISGNGVSYLPLDNVRQLSAATRVLDLSDNRFTELPPYLLHLVRRLDRAYLQHNPWNCDCALKPFSDLLQSRETDASYNDNDNSLQQQLNDGIFSNDEDSYLENKPPVSMEHDEIRCHSPERMRGILVRELDDHRIAELCQSPIFGAVGLTKESEIGILAAGILILFLVLLLASVVAYTYVWAPRKQHHADDDTATYATKDELNISTSSSEHSNCTAPITGPLIPKYIS